MTKDIVFRATKYVGDVEVVNVSGTYSDISKDYLAIFNPITPEHGFRVELAQEINPMEFLERITVSEETEPDLDVADESGWLENFPEDWGFAPTPGQVVRVASLAQADRVWQIIGIPHDGEIIALLKNPDEEYVASERYFSDRVVAEYAVHSEGPGPVSWDNGSAVLEVGPWWVHAYEGDSQSEDYLVPCPENLQAPLLEWLTLNNANELLALNYVPCLWQNEKLKMHFEDLLAEYSEINHLRMQISESEMSSLVTAVREEFPLVQKLMSLLQDPQGVGAQSLLAGLSRALGHQARAFLFADFELGSDENEWNL